VILLAALLYALPYAALLIGGAAEIRALAPDHRKRLFLLACIAFVGATAYALLVHLNPWASPTLFYFLDDASYDRWGVLIAQQWRNCTFPPLGSEHQIGSLHTGYYRFVAAIYLIGGRNPHLIIALNLCACALLPIAIYLLTRSVFNEKTGLIAATVTALYPTFWFYSGFVLRDVWITLFFLALAIVIVQLMRPHSRRQLLVLLACLALFSLQLLLLRFYAAAMLLAGWALYEVTLGPRRKMALAALAVALVCILLMRLHPHLAHLQDRLFQSFTWAIPRFLNSRLLVMQRFFLGLLKLFIGPFAWATRGGYTVDYFLWPGQWLIYLLILPGALWGMWRTVRQGPAIAFLLLFPFVAGAYGFLLAYEGSVPRQRMFLDALLIIFASIALARRQAGSGPSRRYWISWYALFFTFFAAHICWLFARGVWRI